MPIRGFTMLSPETPIMRPLRLLATLVCGAGLVLPAIGQSDFMGLGASPVGGMYCASGVSADGSVVVGEWGTIGIYIEACYWTRETNVVRLGDLPGGGTYSRATAVSADGRVIVGFADSHVGSEPFRWAAQTGMVGLGRTVWTPANMVCVATAVSGDGSMVVGTGGTPTGQQAFIWTQPQGFQAITDPEGLWYVSNATGITPDAAFIVGSVITDTEAAGFVRPASGAIVPVGRLPRTGTGIAATAVSADGQTVVGIRSLGSLTEAFRWTATGGVTVLGDLPGGGFQSEAEAVSADGSTVLGRSRTEVGMEAFIWTADAGMRRLQSVLEDAGVANLAGWTLRNASGVSADGRIVVGTGINPCGQDEGWIARLDGPASAFCAADVNAIGGLTVQDLFEFLGLYFAADRRGDFNRSCDHTVQDIFEFLAAFFAGCPA